MHEHGYKGKKPAGMMHMTKQPKRSKAGSKGTMGKGKSGMKVSGAMGKHQRTGAGEGG